jgi:transcriptional regulator with XRE-family HTH domain
MTGNEILGNRIKEMRKERRLSQAALAEKALIAQSTLSYIEAGKKSPTYETLRAIGEGMDVSVLEILKFDDSPDHSLSMESYYKALRNSLSEDELHNLLDTSALISKTIPNQT